MQIDLQIARVGLLLIASVAMPDPVFAQTPMPVSTEPPTSLTVNQIVNNLVRRNLERARALHSYKGTRIYRLEYRGFPSARSAEITVDVVYRAPATKEFTIRSEKGSHFLVDRVFQRMLQSEKDALNEENQAHVALNNENYRFTLTGLETLPTGPSYVLSVEPRNGNKLLYRGRIWVDAADFAVVRIEAAPAKNPSFWTKETTIEQVYARFGNFWLPVSNRSISSIRLGGRATFTIDYKDYEITSESPLGTQER
jgi:hypothetical protein